MIAQLMVPAEDVALQLWQKTIYHFSNTNPLWVELIPLMKAINDGIRKAAIVVDQQDNFRKHNLTIHTATYSPVQGHSKLGKSVTDEFGWNIWCKLIYHPKKLSLHLLFPPNVGKILIKTKMYPSCFLLVLFFSC